MLQSIFGGLPRNDGSPPTERVATTEKKVDTVAKIILATISGLISLVLFSAITNTLTVFTGLGIIGVGSAVFYGALQLPPGAETSLSPKEEARRAEARQEREKETEKKEQEQRDRIREASETMHSSEKRYVSPGS